MFARFFLAALMAGLFSGLLAVEELSARTSQDYYVSKKKTKSKYLKRKTKKEAKRGKSRSRKIRKAKKRSLRRIRKANISYPVRNIDRTGRHKKVTKASLGLIGIKNARHARLTKWGRMSVAKDTRRSTVRNFGRRVSYKYRPGTVVLSNYTRRLYYVVRPGKVISYPVAIPRPEEVWSGSTIISKKKLNPDWYPTPAMREKNPNLPEKVAGGSRANPFGSRALYLGKSLYRIHGTNRPGSIGKSASGGCYRMRNSDIARLWRRVRVGTPVVVLTKRRI